MNSPSRRVFLQSMGLGAAGLGLGRLAHADDPPNDIAGFDDLGSQAQARQTWEPVSDRKVRVGLVGYGRCQFASQFSFQSHPNVEVAAVSDLIPENCAALAEVVQQCGKTYPSLEEMLKDDSIEAVFLATDAPGHARHAILALEHGKHVACAVPACFGDIEEGERLLETVKKTGLKYMMFETSVFREDCYAMRRAYEAGAFGRIVYSEGEYYHFFGHDEIGSYKGWRDGLPPMYYPTHSMAYYTAVTGQRFTKVSCLGFRGDYRQFQEGANSYGNPFDSEIALLRTTEGGISRIAVCWGLHGMHGETGRLGGEFGGMIGTAYDGSKGGLLPSLTRPPLPPSVASGGHGGAHGLLTDAFITSILADTRPLVDIYDAMNMTVPGIVAHESALKDGEWLDVPQYIRPE
jgi:predicted dehydrogenase